MKTKAVLLSVVLMLCFPLTALACSCSLPPLKSEKARISSERKKSQAVFTGEVVEVIDVEGNVEVKLKVLQSWKGVQSESVSVFTTSICCICGYSFERGETYLIYTYSGNRGELRTNMCTRTQKIADAAIDLRVLGKTKARIVRSS